MRCWYLKSKILLYGNIKESRSTAQRRTMNRQATMTPAIKPYIQLGRNEANKQNSQPPRREHASLFLAHCRLWRKKIMKEKKRKVNILSSLNCVAIQLGLWEACIYMHPLQLYICNQIAQSCLLPINQPTSFDLAHARYLLCYYTVVINQ